MAKAEAKSAPVGVKVGDLAKEFGVPTKIIIERAKALNIEVKNASTVLKPGQADRLRAKLGHADQLREELSKKTHVVPKPKAGAKKAGKKSAEQPVKDDEAEAEKPERRNLRCRSRRSRGNRGCGNARAGSSAGCCRNAGRSIRGSRAR